MKFGLSNTNENSLSSTELVKQLTSIANEEGLSFTETVRRTLESDNNNELLKVLDAFNH